MVSRQKIGNFKSGQIMMKHDGFYTASGTEASFPLKKSFPASEHLISLIYLIDPDGPRGIDVTCNLGLRYRQLVAGVRRPHVHVFICIHCAWQMDETWFNGLFGSRKG